MQDLVNVENGKVTVTSKQVADHFGKVHRNVMRDIAAELKTAGEFGVLNFERSSYKSLQNKELECYSMTRDGFSLLAMRFTGEKAQQWKIKYIEAFNQMEKMLSGEDSVMRQFDKAIKLMEEDKAIASGCGKGLQAWKDIRKDHIAKIEDLRNKAQLLLNFK